MKRTLALGVSLFAALAASVVDATAAPVAATPSGPSADVRRVVEFWTPERMAGAIPRDLVLDPRGLAYLRTPGGGLEPYGHTVAARPTPMGAADTSITEPDPAAGATIGASSTFRVRVTDPDDVRSVSFRIQKSGGAVQTFSGSKAGEIWSVSLQGFTSGSWSWWVVTKDGAPKGGFTATSDTWGFTVDTSGGSGGGGGGGGDAVAEAQWTAGGAVRSAAGRIMFQMPANKRATIWNSYVCSGTAVTDGVSGQSLILTAAHCVYDDVNKAFARNVLFIPDQAGTTGSGSDRVCSNDPIGCWAPDYGVVHTGWSSSRFPGNAAWDYGYYVVATSGRYTAGITTVSASLEAAVPELTPSFAAPSLITSYGLGYSASQDPSFRYCADTLASLDGANWWLAACGLSGGSSGGPWIRSATGAGPVFSVNSWGYTTSPGMAGPKLTSAAASCTYAFADTSRAMDPAARGYLAAC